MKKAIVDYLLRAYRGNTPREVLEIYEQELYGLDMKELADRFMDVVRLQGV